MTEEEWLACDDPQEMSEFVGTPERRKQTLFNAACCRRVLHLTSEIAYHDAVSAAELVEDGVLTEQEFDRAFEPIMRLWAALSPLPPAAPAPCNPSRFLTGATRHLRAPHGWAASFAARAVQCAIAPSQTDATSITNDPTELVAQVRLLRDIFGNPFRCCRFDPVWRTDTAVALARQMYESRDFGAMPILADALQDVGCDNDDILNHCRGEGPHVRGCWVVDLVLGKE